MSWYMEPFHLKSSAVKPPAVELPTAFWYEMVILIHTIFLDKFRLVSLSISSSLGKGSHITSQNRLWDYPTAWWNHRSPWKKLSNHEFVEHHPKKTRKITSFFFRGHLLTDRQWFRQRDAQHTEIVCRSEIFPFFLAGSRGRYPK